MNDKSILSDSSQVVSPDPYLRKVIAVLDTTMAYVEEGTGQPIVFLHGNPTSSYLWRNIIPYVKDYGRCLAPDLVGMGQSGKSPAHQYLFTDQARYLDEWFERMELRENVTLVLHDWGSALGFYWAMRHPERIRAIAYMEAIVIPRRWADFPDGRAALFRMLRSEKGEALVLEENFFIETVLPKSILRQLDAEEMEAYRKPFQNRGDRLPTLVWPRELPIDGEPADVAAIVESYAQWLAGTTFPKLLFAAQPGAILTGRSLAFCRTFSNQTEVSIKGIHYVQEDSPREIGMSLRAFLQGL